MASQSWIRTRGMACHYIYAILNDKCIDSTWDKEIAAFSHVLISTWAAVVTSCWKNDNRKGTTSVACLSLFMVVEVTVT